MRYLVRDDNIWTTLAETQFDQGKLYTNVFRGVLERDPTPVGWGAELERNEYQFDGGSRAQRLELARLRASYRGGPQLLLFVTGGYEPDGSSPAAFGKFLRAESDRYAEMVRIANVPRQ